LRGLNLQRAIRNFCSLNSGNCHRL
jgi:hypothetical protein